MLTSGNLRVKGLMKTTEVKEEVICLPGEFRNGELCAKRPLSNVDPETESTARTLDHAMVDHILDEINGL